MEEHGGSLRGKVLPFSFLLSPSSFLLLAAALLLPGCGFHLRGTAAMPFESIYVQPGPAPQLATQIKRAMAAGSRTRIADKPEDAQVVLHITNELREKQILSLSGGGRVREFELRYRLVYRLTDNKAANEYIAPSEIVLRRDFSYNDQEALAKESEEALLYRDMQSDAVQQLVRRLQTAKLADKS
jgi:LPS-assembly lipoprotein